MSKPIIMKLIISIVMTIVLKKKPIFSLATSSGLKCVKGKQNAKVK